MILYLFYDTNISWKMPSIKCPIAECPYETGDVETNIAVALLNIHAAAHPVNSPGSNSSSVRPPPLERPKITAGCPTAEFEVFSAKWRSFKTAAGLASDKVVHHLFPFQQVCADFMILQ